MKIRDYCNNVSTELTMWKAKLYDVISKMDKLPTGSKEKMYEEINGLHILMAELDDRLDQLQRECPTEWSPQQEDMTKKFKQLNAKYDKVVNTLFDYDFGG